MQPNSFVAPTLPEGFDSSQSRGYRSLTPWLPLILSGISVFFMLAFIVFAIFAFGEEFSNAFDDAGSRDSDRFGAFVAIALGSLLGWLVTALGAFVSLVVAVARGFTRSLWMTPAVLLAGLPFWLMFFAWSN